MAISPLSEPVLFPRLGIGIGLRAVHYRDFLEKRPKVDWLEVHTENHLDPGNRDAHVLQILRADYPISLHGVGLGVGSAAGISETHLQRVGELVQRIEPAFVSEHLCWSAAGGKHLNDLMPMPLTVQALELVCRHVDQVQHVLGRRLLLENVSTYLRYRDDTMSEAFFLAEVARRTGCGILLDINNLYVNQCNHREDALSALAAFDAGMIGELHLAGHLVTPDAVIDHHGDRVSEPVWTLYEAAIRRFGNVSALIEWDTDIPPLDVLLDEAQRARSISDAVSDANIVDLGQAQSAFADALFDARLEDQTLSLFAGDTQQARRRLSLYRGNLTANWNKALANAYPVLKMLVGDEFFTGLARAYGKSFPSSDGDLNRFGEHLCDFFRGFSPAAGYPYFPDMARLEWALHRAHHAGDAVPISLSDVAELTPEQIDGAHVRLHPACRAMAFDWNVIDIWKAHQSNEEVAWPQAIERPVYGVVVRRQWEVDILPLTCAEERALAQLEQCHPVGTALDVALEIDPGFDFGHTLEQWLAHGIFIAIVPCTET